MKFYYKIKIGVAYNEDTGLVGYTNKHAFNLNTTGFNKITSTNWVSLGEINNRVAVKDSLFNFGARIPITTEFVNEICVDFEAMDAIVGSFSVLADYDEKLLRELDQQNLATLEMTIVSEEG